jgi:hypothetical protein
VTLRHHDDDQVARCAHCGKPAAGPCATCHRPVCGDCCTLTEGGVKVWAVCLDCDRKGARTLAPAWRGTALFLGGILLVLAAATVLLGLLQR